MSPFLAFETLYWFLLVFEGSQAGSVDVYAIFQEFIHSCWGSECEHRMRKTLERASLGYRLDPSCGCDCARRDLAILFSEMEGFVIF